MDKYLISSVFAIVFAALFLIGVSVGGQALATYKKGFQQAAKVNLAELYLFIEPEKIFLLNIISMLFFALTTYIVFSSWLIALVVLVASALIPNTLYKVLRKRRQRQFLKDLPEALRQVASSLSAGLGLNQSIEGVISVSKGAVQQEFDLLLREVRMGLDFSEALDNLYARMPIVELNLMVSCIKISRETGGNLAENLLRLADTLRRKLEMEGKIQALTAQGRAQGYVMTALPLLLGLVIYKMEPDEMMKLWTTSFGLVWLGTIVLLQILGFFFIRKIVNIDV